MANPTAPAAPAAPATPNPIKAVARDALPAIPLIEARYYTRTPRARAAIWIVVHATAGAEGVGKAMAGAVELANLKPTDRQRSPHLFIDTGAVVQCVPFTHAAWHAGHNANAKGEGIELCGSTDQTREQWLDAKSLPMLCLAARVLRWRATELGIPLVHVTADGLLAGDHGITTHADVSRAFPHDTNHTDPGAGFPLAELLAAARDAAA